MTVKEALLSGIIKVDLKSEIFACKIDDKPPIGFFNVYGTMSTGASYQILVTMRETGTLSFT